MAATPTNAADTSEIIRTTGQRVETSFWTTLNDLLLHVPNILGFLLAVGAAWLLGRGLGALLSRRLERKNKADLGRLLGASLTFAVALTGGLFALMLLFPGINPTSILSVLGIGSVAVGFAFKDIFQNLVAGIILLIREPYKKGDEVCVDGEEGIVEEVETRATHIRTIDQRLVIIPNVRIFTSSITVNTERAYRMTTYTLSIAYGGDPKGAMDVVLGAVRSVGSVRAEPPPQIAIQALNDYSIDLLVTYAAASPELEQIRTKGAVLLAIHDACRANAIALALPTQVNLIQPLETEQPRPDKLDGLTAVQERQSHPRG